MLPVVVRAVLQAPVQQRFPRPHGPGHVAAFAIHGDALVAPHRLARVGRGIRQPRRAGTAAQHGAQAALKVDRRQQVVGGEVVARRRLQAFRAGRLPEHRRRLRAAGEGEHRLQGVRALVGGVHAGAGVDEAHPADGAVRDQALQAPARGVVVELVVDRHLQRRGARERGQRRAVGPVDGDRFLDDRRRHPGGRDLLQQLQARVGRRVDVHHVGPLAGQHLAVVVVARGDAVGIGQLVPLVHGTCRHRHQLRAPLVAIRQRMVPRPPAAGADDHTPIVACHARYCSMPAPPRGAAVPVLCFVVGSSGARARRRRSVIPTKRGCGPHRAHRASCSGTVAPTVLP